MQLSVDAEMKGGRVSLLHLTLLCLEKLVVESLEVLSRASLQTQLFCGSSACCPTAGQLSVILISELL